MAFDPYAGAACLAEAQAAQAQGDCASPLLVLDRNDCDAVFTPAVAEGAACDINSEDCVQRPDGGQVTCLNTAGTCGGVCSGGHALGESCAGPDTTCAEGFCDAQTLLCTQVVDGMPCQGRWSLCALVDDYCRGDGGPAICVPRRQTGQDCASTNGDNCTSGDVCLPVPDGGTETYCVAQLPAGAACDAANDLCGAGVCVNGFCTVLTGEVGTPCFSGYTLCNDGYCASADGGVGTCAASPQLGEPCDALTPCSTFGGLSYLACVNHTCQALPVYPNPCTVTDLRCAPGDYCTSEHFCQPYGQLGSNCGVGSNGSLQGQCIDGYCDATTFKCAPFKATGAPCNPADLDCSAQQTDAQAPDSGVVTVDAYCYPTTAGDPNTCHLSVCR